MASGEEHYFSKTDVSKSIRWVVGLVVGTIALVLGIILLATSIARPKVRVFFSLMRRFTSWQSSALRTNESAM